MFYLRMRMTRQSGLPLENPTCLYYSGRVSTSSAFEMLSKTYSPERPELLFWLSSQVLRVPPLPPSDFFAYHRRWWRENRLLVFWHRLKIHTITFDADNPLGVGVLYEFNTCHDFGLIIHFWLLNEYLNFLQWGKQKEHCISHSLSATRGTSGDSLHRYVALDPPSREGHSLSYHIVPQIL